MKLYDSELKIMDVLWKRGDLSAGQLAKILKEVTGWNRNTTYTVIKKCIEKCAVERYTAFSDRHSAPFRFQDVSEGHGYQ